MKQMHCLSGKVSDRLAIIIFYILKATKTKFPKNFPISWFDGWISKKKLKIFRLESKSFVARNLFIVLLSKCNRLF
jgi:hypothetical protein